MACMCIIFPRFVKAMSPLKFNECETNKKIFVRCQVLFGRKKLDVHSVSFERQGIFRLQTTAACYVGASITIAMTAGYSQCYV